MKRSIAIVLVVLLEAAGQVPEARGQVLEVRGQVPEVRGQVLEVRGQVLEVRGQVPEVRGQVPEVRGQVLEARGQGPGRRGQLAGARRPASRSLGKKILFTTIGAAGGFAAGLYFGLKYFDDALYSDRKVWTCVAVGAVAGGVAGALLSPDVASTSGWKPSESAIETPLVPSAALTTIPAGTGSAAQRALIERIRKVNPDV